MNKLMCLFLFIIVSCRAQTNNNDYQNMKEIIDENIKNTIYSEVFKKNGIQTQFYITNLSSDTKETIKSNSLKENKFLQDGVYVFYVKDIRYSFTHIYVKHKGKIKIFESINCPNDNLKINQAIAYIRDNFKNEESVVNNILSYSKYINYLKVDPQSKLNCIK